MSVKLIVLKSTEDVIADVSEIEIDGRIFGYKIKNPKIKLHSHVTSQYILSKELYLPRVSMTKEEIKEKSLELSKMLLEEDSNG